MKKSFRFDQLAKDVTGSMRTHCARCGDPLKANLVARKDNDKPLVDFKCFREMEASKGHDMSTAREVRNGTRPAKMYRETIAETKAREKREGGGK
jgi:hypothetical protein